MNMTKESDLGLCCLLWYRLGFGCSWERSDLGLYIHVSMMLAVVFTAGFSGFCCMIPFTESAMGQCSSGCI